ncbi:hypothetical protein [Nocardia rhizosphaerae]|uniref:Uncharacterized protein n=1 Tax=Nocardia rhizosphaerae TaxID=1691571 RepID=A0ABV8L3Z8_9NOCA
MEASEPSGLQRCNGFRIAVGIAQIVLGFVAGYLVTWATMLAVLEFEIATGWMLPWLMDTWLVPAAVTVGLVSIAWVTLPRLRIALVSAAVGTVTTSGIFLWLFVTW